MSATPLGGAAPLLRVQDLHIAFKGGRGAGDDPRTLTPAVRGVGFALAANQTLGLVGESGSGKSVSAMALVGLLPPNAVLRGQITWTTREGRAQALLDGDHVDRSAVAALRGREIACVFQDPMSSLNPVFSIGNQLVEPLVRHRGLTRRQAHERAAELLAEVGLDEPRRRLAAYPHQLSGGQQQRVMIAMALACEPRLLIADEPTTALDVTIQRQVLELIARLRERHAMSVLFISHDLAVVRELADQVVVMRQGVVREQGPAAQVFAAPQDAYTRALLACRPTLQHQPHRLAVIDEALLAQGDVAAAQPPAAQAMQAMQVDPRAPGDAEDAPPLLEVEGLGKSWWRREGLWRKAEFKAVQGVSFRLRRGRTLGIVGESGSGKTTLGLALLRLVEASAGRVRFDGIDLFAATASERQVLRRRIQVVFQNPYASLNPRFSVAESLTEPMAIHGLGGDAARRLQRARELLARVGLPEQALGRYPHEFSGGQRQRIAIARALALQPELLVLDEAVSALDVSVQAQILNLLKDLQDELGITYLFISHDLAVVRHMADEVLVMQAGQVVEQGPAAEIIERPREAYTQRLVAAVPRLVVG